MLNLLSVLDKHKFYPRYYIAACTDRMSLRRAQTVEDSVVEKEPNSSKQCIHYLQIYRSREVGQSYLTSVPTTLIAAVHGLWLVFCVRPNVILCNGPGTCIPICIAGFLLKVVAVKWVVIIYVESIARVRRMSLSGLILYKLQLADKFLVQWHQLHQQFPRSTFVGRLM
eukprot:c20408_g1_i1 orf=140-646(+)